MARDLSRHEQWLAHCHQAVAASKPATLYLRARARISFPGVPPLSSGDVGQVPLGCGELAHRLVAQGMAEFVEGRELQDVPPCPAELAPQPTVEELEAAELVRMQNELDALEAAEAAKRAEQASASAPLPRPSRQVDCKECGKPYPEHAPGKRPVDETLGCKGLKRGFVPPTAA